jgi:hypothetical protein
MDRVSPADQVTADQTYPDTTQPMLAPDQPDQTDAQPESQIDCETEAVIQQYFETFNTGNFAAIAGLFAPEGALYPPFESAVVGPDAIAAYLNQEAQGMTIEARQCVQNLTETGEIEVQVAGKVQTPLFGVNVRWLFELNDRLEILSVRIKLLAALEDLLKLKQ